MDNKPFHESQKKSMGKLMINDRYRFFSQKHKNKELRIESEMVCKNYTSFTILFFFEIYNSSLHLSKGYRKEKHRL
jgi:hypothetical protein